MRFFKIEKIFEELHIVVTPCNSCKLCNCCPFGDLFSSKKKGQQYGLLFRSYKKLHELQIRCNSLKSRLFLIKGIY